MAAAQVDHRLEPRLERAVVQAGADLGVEGKTLLCLDGQAGIGELVAVASVLLRLAQGEARVAEEPLGIGVPSARDDADAHGGGHRLAGDLDLAARAGMDLVGDRRRVGAGAQVAQHDDQLVAGAASKALGVADRGDHACGHRRDEQVASRVAERLVDLRQAVDPQAQHTDAVERLELPLPLAKAPDHYRPVRQSRCHVVP
jgi:hypothetical protein